ncbi:MAG TPA: hypothetical protein VNF04_10330 [Stellaceae bacterium]|nr:hypothetical protein [Stellaceae bacterium]
MLFDGLERRRLGDLEGRRLDDLDRRLFFVNLIRGGLLASCLGLDRRCRNRLDRGLAGLGIGFSLAAPDTLDGGADQIGRDMRQKAIAPPFRRCNLFLQCPSATAVSARSGRSQPRSRGRDFGRQSLQLHPVVGTHR